MAQGEYTSEFTGEQIDALLEKVDQRVSTPAPAEDKLITSGGVYTATENKVDKVTGKGLSTNDYTDAEKTKLGALPTKADLDTALAAKEDKANKVTSFSSPTDTQYPSAKLTKDSLDAKADKDTDAVEGNLAQLDANGNPVDSGIASDEIGEIEEAISVLRTKAGIAEGIADTISAGTAQEFLQRQSGGDGVNCLKRIKGKTRAWNQIFNNATNPTFSYSEGASYPALASPISAYTVVPQHIYYAYVKMVVSSGTMPTNIYFTWKQTSDYQFAPNTRKILRPNSSEGGTMPANSGTLRVFSSSASACSGTSEVTLIDLSLIYGDEIAGLTNDQILAKFQAEYPELYYGYNPGVLKNNDAVAMITNGFNQWDEEWELGTINTQGQPDTNSNQIRSKNFIPAFGGNTYYIKGSMQIHQYRADKSYIDNRTFVTNSTITLAAECRYIKFRTGDGVTSYNPLVNPICINLSNPAKNGIYEPYWTRKVNFGLDAIKVKSPNIWDEELEVGVLVSDGTVDSTATERITTSFIPVIPGKTYYFKIGNLTANGQIAYYDADKNFISMQYSWAPNASYTIPSNAYFVRFNPSYLYGTTYNHDICVNLSAPGINGNYFPHGILTYNGMDGAGTAFDFIFKDANGVQKLQKTMLAEVDLGDLGWTYTSQYNNFTSTTAPVGIKGVDYSTKANAVCSKYIVASGSTIVVDSLILNENGNIVIKTTAYSDAAAFKAAMAGVKLIAEAATPAILELAEPIPDTILVDDYGTERIQAPEGATTPSAPFCCDSNYSISIANLVKKLNTL